MPIFEDLFSLTDATSSANMKTGKKSGSIVRNGKDTRTNESIIKFMNLLGIINPRENHSNTDHFNCKNMRFIHFLHISSTHFVVLVLKWTTEKKAIGLVCNLNVTACRIFMLSYFFRTNGSIDPLSLSSRCGFYSKDINYVHVMMNILVKLKDISK